MFEVLTAIIFLIIIMAIIVYFLFIGCFLLLFVISVNIVKGVIKWIQRRKC